MVYLCLEVELCVIFEVWYKPDAYFLFYMYLFFYFQEKEEIEGVSVGAILSDYQRGRVENV